MSSFTDNSNRFTLADYDYERDERPTSHEYDQYGHYTPQPHAESSQQAMNKAATASAMAAAVSGSGSSLPTSSSTSTSFAAVPISNSTFPPMSASASASSSLAPPSATYRPPIRRQASDGVPASGSAGTLRLHEHYPPTSPPTQAQDVPLASPLSHIAPELSPANSYTDTHLLYLDPRPLPSLESARSHEGITSDDGRGMELGMALTADRRSVMSDTSGKGRDEKKRGFDEPLTPVPALVRRSSSTHGIFRRMVPSTLYTRLLLATILTETVINLAIEGNILYRFNEEVKSTTSTDLELENKRRLPIYLIIFGLAHLWQIVLTVIAIRTKNTIQVMSVTAFNYAFLGYAIIQIYELRKILGDNLATELAGDEHMTTLMTIPLNVLTALIIAIVAASCLVLSVLSFFIQREFGWQRYRFLGADLMIREYYFKFQVFECICYFSAFFCAGFGIQFIWLVLNPNDVEYVITWVAFPVLLIFLVIGRFAAKYENRYLMAAFMVGLTAGCAYFIFKLARIWQLSSTTYRSTAKSLTTFDALSIVSLVGCAVWGFMVWANFGKGLKSALLSRPGAITNVATFWRTNSVETEEKGQEMTLAQRRISID
ncbi:hypothetical protein I317_00799 [Kwoniella heveanensis CBS 569]|nr:hypothetical protein I317_00799 [Kwoniella heveanensis CBS 569]